MRFTYGAYLDLLDELSGRYSLHPLREFTSEPRRLYLRHDIDVCPKRALRMAEQEARRSYRSTYMFIPTCPLYELSSDVLRPFVDLGHEVALHFDYRTSGIDPDDIEPAVRDQCDKLSRFTGEPVRSISFHRPIEQYLRGPDHLFGLVNAYSATLMACYRSDSAGRWRQDPRDMDAPIAQLLTHPMRWGEAHEEPFDRLYGYYQEAGAGEELRAMLAEAAPRVWA